MTVAEWFSLAEKGGAYISPLLMAAIFWLNNDRNRLIAENKLKDERLVRLSDRLLTVTAELKTFLFHERRA